MLIIPALDLRGGKVVRLWQGKFDQEKVYSADPVKVAKHWAKGGAKFLHIVDLDGAKFGVPKNLAVVKDIIAKVGLGVEFGGGVRSLAVLAELFSLGVQRVVLGTKAVKDAVFLKAAWKKYGARIIVSIDARNSQVLVDGWNLSSKKTVLDFALELKKMGFRQLIYTDISKDGTLSGPNIKALKELLKVSGLSIIASGGVSNLKDLLALKKLEKQGVSGVIIGKALYEGKFNLREALEIG